LNILLSELVIEYQIQQHIHQSTYILMAQFINEIEIINDNGQFEAKYRGFQLPENADTGNLYLDSIVIKDEGLAMFKIIHNLMVRCYFDGSDYYSTPIETVINLGNYKYKHPLFPFANVKASQLHGFYVCGDDLVKVIEYQYLSHYARITNTGEKIYIDHKQIFLCSYNQLLNTTIKNDNINIYHKCTRNTELV
jgi:hypothetical protein